MVYSHELAMAVFSTCVKFKIKLHDLGVLKVRFNCFCSGSFYLFIFIFIFQLSAYPEGIVAL